MAIPRQGHSFHLFPFPPPPHWSSYFLEKTEDTRRAHLYLHVPVSVSPLPPVTKNMLSVLYSRPIPSQDSTPAHSRKWPSFSYVICLFPLYFLILTSIQTCHLFCFFNLLTPHALPDISPHFCPSSELPSGLRYSLVSLSSVLLFSTEVLQSGCCSQDTGTRDLQIVNSINCSSSSYVTHLWIWQR